MQGQTSGTFYLPAESSYPGNYDIIVLTVKAYQTSEAIESISKVYNGEPIITFQNGVGIVEILNEFDVIPGVITHGANIVAPGIVNHAGYGDTYIGEIDGKISNRVRDIAKLFTRSGLKTEAVNDIMKRRWLKAAVNGIINPITAIAKVKNGELLNNPHLVEIAKCLEGEIYSSLKNKGFVADLHSLVEDVILKTKENRSSMLQDIERGKRTEIDYILKPFVGGPCSMMVYHLVKAIEQKAQI